MKVTRCRPPKRKVTSALTPSVPDYEKAESIAVKIVADFTINPAIIKEWGKKYKAATKLDALGLGSMDRGTMPGIVNRILKKNYENPARVGAIDMQQTETMGAFIKLFCDCAKVAIPEGRPK